MTNWGEISYLNRKLNCDSFMSFEAYSFKFACLFIVEQYLSLVICILDTDLGTERVIGETRKGHVEIS